MEGTLGNGFWPTIVVETSREVCITFLVAFIR